MIKAGCKDQQFTRNQSDWDAILTGVPGILRG